MSTDTKSFITFATSLQPSFLPPLAKHSNPTLRHALIVLPSLRLNRLRIFLLVRLDLRLLNICVPPFELTWKDARTDRYDNRKPPCWPVNTCWWWNDSLRVLMNSDEMKEIFGVPSHLTRSFLGLSSLYFYLNADN